MNITQSILGLLMATVNTSCYITWCVQNIITITFGDHCLIIDGLSSLNSDWDKLKELGDPVRICNVYVQIAQCTVFTEFQRVFKIQIYNNLFAINFPSQHLKKKYKLKGWKVYSIQKICSEIYQTRLTVFYRISKHRD